MPQVGAVTPKGAWAEERLFKGEGQPGKDVVQLEAAIGNGQEQVHSAGLHKGRGKVGARKVLEVTSCAAVTRCAQHLVCQICLVAAGQEGPGQRGQASRLTLQHEFGSSRLGRASHCLHGIRHAAMLAPFE